MHFLAVKKKNHSVFLLIHILKTVRLQKVKEMQSSQLGMSKECHFSRYAKGVSFPYKMVKKGTF